MQSKAGGGLSGDAVELPKAPRVYKGCTRDVQGIPKGYPRDTQGIPKGYLRDTQGHSSVTTPSQLAHNAVASPSAGAALLKYRSMAFPARLPSPIARITVAAPRTMSPPANTPGILVMPVSSTMMLPHLFSLRSGQVAVSSGLARVPMAKIGRAH